MASLQDFCSLIVTLIIVVWEWLENPGRIFHNKDGTNWHFIYETGISWFIPAFIYIALIAAIVHLLLSAFKWLQQARHK